MKGILKTLIKKIKLSHLIILLVLLVCNSYAWFIYATKVSGTFQTHITSWNVSFQAGEDETVTNMNFTVDRIYPGMETYSQDLIAYNTGEVTANLSYEILSVTILGTTYATDEDTTSSDLVDMIQNDFPFTISVTVDNNLLSAEDGEGVFTISLEWPFESGNDELDTYWGEQAYTFFSTHPQEASIDIEMNIIATQNRNG